MKKTAFQTPRVALISFSHFVHDLYSSFLPPLLPLIIEKLSLTLSQAGLLSFVMQVPAMLNPLIGLFADNKKVARWLVILAPSFTALPMSLIMAAPSYFLLLILLFLSGISAALYHVPSPVLVAGYSGIRKGRGMSLFMSGGELARTLGPMVAVAALAWLGVDRFYLVFGLAVMTSVLLWLTLESPPEKPEVRRNGSLKQAYVEIRHVLKPLSGILAARAGMHASMGIFLSVFIKEQTGSLWYGGAALALYEAFGVAGVLSAGTLSDWIGRRKVLFWALATAPVTLLLFVHTTGFLKIGMLVITGFSVLSTTPVMLAIVQDNAQNHPSAANGMFMMVSFAVRSFAVVVVGAVGDMAGMENMFVFSAVVGFVSLPFLIWLPDRKKDM
ncbi:MULTISPECIES: MFS transporter [Desulfotignum]|jgi:FSR family fosmidomycin resistance protein-like MFS transporter|uniref:Membrane efflux protein, major facilitator superfamily MFS_1 n=1 Tax=Desulfotignum phosphitoxidans DSM 13687 TaxID=1286635 RepID=S0FT50_9BACT|nr:MULTISPECIES: MFS transporter [Desulfotignum]EMS78268.1 membrane efflux protein, major facilitator superfamily MFS_1 [Desulfotignum phosphitoxidans DSM 13687]